MTSKQGLILILITIYKDKIVILANYFFTDYQ